MKKLRKYNNQLLL